jgi:hypothetical protein
MRARSGTRASRTDHDGALVLAILIEDEGLKRQLAGIQRGIAATDSEAARRALSKSFVLTPVAGTTLRSRSPHGCGPGTRTGVLSRYHSGDTWSW